MILDIYHKKAPAENIKMTIWISVAKHRVNATKYPKIVFYVIYCNIDAYKLKIYINEIF